jgi:hypothetical protein
MSNYVFDFDEFAAQGKVSGMAVMTHFGGTGKAPLPLELPLAIYDVTLKLHRTKAGSWLLDLWQMRPVFLASTHPALSMPRDFSHPAEHARP